MPRGTSLRVVNYGPTFQAYPTSTGVVFYDQSLDYVYTLPFPTSSGRNPKKAVPGGDQNPCCGLSTDQEGSVSTLCSSMQLSATLTLRAYRSLCGKIEMSTCSELRDQPVTLPPPRGLVRGAMSSGSCTARSNARMTFARLS